MLYLEIAGLIALQLYDLHYALSVFQQCHYHRDRYRNWITKDLEEDPQFSAVSFLFVPKNGKGPFPLYLMCDPDLSLCASAAKKRREKHCCFQNIPLDAACVCFGGTGSDHYGICEGVFEL